ncbi:hypothetical protein WJX72_007534 [[Myrmecia] bisecta]|uniref:Uncharacterized protein n=1 Tax=[Myrmecia] bisecta TaxID=41462 RepID=A0AAW1R789_9CHLO
MREGKQAVCFFLVAVAYTSSWQAVSSLLAYFKSLYGPQVLLDLNTAWLLPGIPILLLSQWDAYDSYGPALSAKLVTGMAASAALCAVFPLIASTEARLLALVTTLGLFSAVSFGSSYQLVARFPPSCTVALTTGYVGSGPLIIALEAYLRLGPSPSQKQVVQLFVAVALLALCGVAAAILLLRTQGKEQEAMLSGHSGFLLDRPHMQPAARRWSNAFSGGPDLPTTFRCSLDIPASGSPASEDCSQTSSVLERTSLLGGSDDCSQPAAVLSGRDLVAALWPAAMALFLSAGSSVLCFPFFSYLTSSVTLMSNAGLAG